jgi:hypothetical protein
MQWLLLLLLLLLPCAGVVKRSAHATLEMLGSLLCTPSSSEFFPHLLRFIPLDFGDILP